MRIATFLNLFHLSGSGPTKAREGMPVELFTEIDLSPERVRGYVAGLRPFRQGSPRLEVQHIGKKTVAHNYGHGGSGITMAWGSCLELLDQLDPALADPSPVAVLGAGVMGLCAATLLQERGHEVCIYAARLPEETVSMVAGGLWAPTHVGSEKPSRHERILRRSWHAYEQLKGAEFGVYEVPLFESDDRAYPLDPVPAGLTPPPRRLAQLPFSGRRPSGTVSSTFLIETSTFLNRLWNDFQARGGRTKQGELENLEAVEQLRERVVVNCCGLGARELVPDKTLSPIRGQLVLLEPAPRQFVLDYAQGYVISRSDVLVLGGTFEEGEEEARPQHTTCAKILHEAREFFGV